MENLIGMIYSQNDGDYKLVSIEGSGGWTRSDYKIEIQSR